MLFLLFLTAVLLCSDSEEAKALKVSTWRAMADFMHAVVSIAHTHKYDVTGTCVQGRTFASGAEVAWT